MTFPNTRQVTAMTGTPVRHDYGSYYRQKSRTLPSRIALQDRENYFNEMLGINRNYTDKMYELNEDRLKAGERDRERANKIRLMGLGIAGANTVNEITDGGITKAGSAALDMLKPSKDVSDMAGFTPGGFNLGGIDKAGSAEASPIDSGGFWKGVTDVAANGGGTLGVLGGKIKEWFVDVTGFGDTSSGVGSLL